MLTFQQGPVNVLVLRLGECWVLVKQVCNKGQVQLRVAADDVCWSNKLPAAQPVCLLQHILSPLQVIFLLKRQKRHSQSYCRDVYLPLSLSSSVQS